MNSLRSGCSLEDIALRKLAVELCHNYQNLKTSILCFPVSVYSNFFYTTNSDMLGSKSGWEDTIEMQAKVVCEIIPLPSLKLKLLACIRQIALQWINWARQHEKIFELPREFCSNFIIPEDWSVQGNLNGKEVAERLVQDQNIHVYQRYRIACTYFLESFIHNLWIQIPDMHKHYFCSTENASEDKLVKLWSCRMVLQKFIFDENTFWQNGLLLAVEAGIFESVTYCWSNLKDVDKEIAAHAAYQANHFREEMEDCARTINFYRDCETWCTPPIYYNNILCFLLTSMLEGEHISFFYDILRNPYYLTVLECFLQWPCQDYFLPTINQLWGVLPEEVYGELLLLLVQMYTKNTTFVYYKTLNQDYDYKIMLESLWEQTPNNYKFHLCRDMSNSAGGDLLVELLLKEHFNTQTMEIIKSIMKYATYAEKEDIFVFISENILKQRGFKFFCNAIAECFSEGDRLSFQKHFILSASGCKECFRAVCDGNETYANLLIDWGMLSVKETAEFKYALIFEKDNISTIGDLFVLDKINSVEKVMLWSLPKAELQCQFKQVLELCEGMRICVSLIQNIKWEQLEQFLTWCFSSEDYIEHFKKRLFATYGFKIHYSLISEGHWQDAAIFLKWLHLTPEEIKNFKKVSLCSDSVTWEICIIICGLESDKCYLANGGKWEYVTLISRWGLTDKNSVHEFKEKVLNTYGIPKNNENFKHNINIFENIMQEILCDVNSE